MEFYLFVRSGLAWLASIALLYPLNVPMLYLAYRIREGPARTEEEEENRMENGEVWTRSFLGGLGVAGLLVAVLFGDLVLADWLGFPPGIIHFVAFLSALAAAAGVLMYFFGDDDYFRGLALFALYVGLPFFVLWLANALLGLWNPVLRFILSYLKEVPA